MNLKSMMAADGQGLPRINDGGDSTWKQRKTLYDMYVLLDWDLTKIRGMKFQEASEAITKAFRALNNRRPPDDTD